MWEKARIQLVMSGLWCILSSLEFNPRIHTEANNKRERGRLKYLIEPRVTRTFSAYTKHEEGSSCTQRITNRYLDPR